MSKCEKCGQDEAYAEKQLWALRWALALVSDWVPADRYYWDEYNKAQRIKDDAMARLPAQSTTESSTESRRAPSPEGGAPGATHERVPNDTSGTAGVAPRLSAPIAPLTEGRFSRLALELRRDAVYSDRVGGHVVTAVLTPSAARELADLIAPRVVNSLPALPAPAVTYADHSYPAFSRVQMEEYGRACALNNAAPEVPR